MSVAVVGVEGGGLTWADVEERAAGRLRVRSLYDGVRVRADRAASGVDRPPTVELSATKAAERSHVVAGVVLDAGWAGYAAAEAFCERERAVLWFDDWPPPESWSRRGLANDLLIPGVRLHYEPSTIRLREHIATGLGSVDDVTVQTDRPLWEAADWASWISASPVQDGEPVEGGVRVYLRSGVEVLLSAGGKTSAAVRCENGEARWTPDELTVSGEPDTRAGGRPAETVLLDLFARRLAGGLVPVPSVEDVRVAIAATEVVG